MRNYLTLGELRGIIILLAVLLILVIYLSWDAGLFTEKKNDRFVEKIVRLHCVDSIVDAAQNDSVKKPVTACERRLRCRLRPRRFLDERVPYYEDR